MRKIIFILLAALLLCAPVRAAEDTTARQGAALGADTLPQALDADVRAQLRDVSPVTGGDFLKTLSGIVSDALTGALGGTREAAKTLCALLAAVILCAMAENFGAGAAGRAVTIAGALAVTGVCTAGLQTMFGLAADTLDRVCNFTTLLLPVLSAAVTAAGAPSTGAALYAGSMLFMDVLLTLIRRLLQPLVYAFAALAAADCAVGQGKLAKLRELIGWVIAASLKGVMYLFTAYLTLSGVVTGASDAAGARAVKAGLSAALPVVGGIVSDATESVLAGAGAVKAAAGAFGLLAVLAMGLFPFLRIGVQYLTLRVAAAAGGTVGSGGLSGLISQLAAAMGYMLAMTGCALLMALICCTCFIKAAGA